MFSAIIIAFLILYFLILFVGHKLFYIFINITNALIKFIKRFTKNKGVSNGI